MKWNHTAATPRCTSDVGRALPLSVAVAEEASDVAAALQSTLVAPGENGKPSTGAHAVAAVAGLCDSLDLYGFAGTGSVDAHFDVAVDHHLIREHEFLAAVANGTALGGSEALRPLLAHGDRGTLRIHTR